MNVKLISTSSEIAQCFSNAGPREILLELITNLNVILYLSTYHTVHISVLNTLYDYAIINYQYLC